MRILVNFQLRSQQNYPSQPLVRNVMPILYCSALFVTYVKKSLLTFTAWAQERFLDLLSFDDRPTPAMESPPSLHLVHCTGLLLTPKKGSCAVVRSTLPSLQYSQSPQSKVSDLEPVDAKTKQHHLHGRWTNWKLSNRQDLRLQTRSNPVPCDLQDKD